MLTPSCAQQECIALCCLNIQSKKILAIKRHGRVEGVTGTLLLPFDPLSVTLNQQYSQLGLEAECILQEKIAHIFQGIKLDQKYSRGKVKHHLILVTAITFQEEYNSVLMSHI